MNSKHLMRGIFVLALLSSLGSLYYGYFGDPVLNAYANEWWNIDNALAICEMCRYIRVCTYPLVLISGTALLYKDYTHIQYIWPLAFLGLIAALYKYWLEKFATTGDSSICIGGVSCSDIGVQYFGFVTLSFMGITSFSLILYACRLIWIRK